MLIALIPGTSHPCTRAILHPVFFKYKIEGHSDVARLTDIPIMADVPVASETAKIKADIVVHENKNNMMEEVFRSMRTNMQFMLEEGQKVIMLTSTTSGEGKTFIAANLAMSFASWARRRCSWASTSASHVGRALRDYRQEPRQSPTFWSKDAPTWADLQ
jgi:hypothetical protein